MKKLEWKYIKFVFKVGCIVFTLVLLAKWLERYFLDEDMTIIENREYFMHEEDIFPVMSLCFKQTFDDKIFKTFGYNFQGSKYEKYLNGDYFDKNMNNIPYDRVTTNISDYIISYDVYFKNGSSDLDTKANLAWKPPYVSYSWKSWHDFVKCFSFELTDKNVHHILIHLRRDIFPKQIRPQSGGFAVLFHYPNQILASIHSITRQWSSRKKRSNYWMDFNIRTMNVVVRRYKQSSNNCIENWKNYDNVVLEQLIEAVGCKAPYQNPERTWPTCESEEKMKKVQFPIEIGPGFTRPCREIENIDYQTLDSDFTHARQLEGNKQGKEWRTFFGVVWRFLNTRFVSTISKKALDLESLIGYMGGYIGMFTGFALAQIPEILISTVVFAKKLFKFRVSQSPNENEVLPTS
jgi:hypothetical protein